MKNIFNGLNKIFESRIRLGIMSTLAVNDGMNFSSLKEILELTDGNLANHLKALEKEKYISIKKSFVERKPNTKYFITTKGRKAFLDYIEFLEEIVKKKSDFSE